MEITGRLTADAKKSILTDGRKVVNFSVAINDRYKSKGNEQETKRTIFINCSYWINPAIAPYLTKGLLVELFGRIGINAWTGKDGDAKATLTFHVNSIKLHGKSNGSNSTTNETPVIAAPAVIVNEDLPF